MVGPAQDPGVDKEGAGREKGWEREEQVFETLWIWGEIVLREGKRVLYMG